MRDLDSAFGEPTVVPREPAAVLMDQWVSGHIPARAAAELRLTVSADRHYMQVKHVSAA